MRLAFAGTPEFARVALARLHGAGFDIALVLSQPDRPAGRGMKVAPSPVKAFALEHGIAVAQPRGLRLDGKFSEDAAAAKDALAAAAPDVIVVAAYGLILPPWLPARSPRPRSTAGPSPRPASPTPPRSPRPRRRSTGARRRARSSAACAPSIRRRGRGACWPARRSPAGAASFARATGSRARSSPSTAAR